jgi:hypothetical protein
MTWLSKVGSVLAKLLGFVSGLTPLVGPAFGQQAQQAVAKAASELTNLRDVIVTVETAFQAAGLQKSGPQKLKAAVPFFSKIINQSEAFAGIKIADQEKYAAAITGIASSFADLLNSFHPDSAQTKG